ncbi:MULTISPECIES: ion transporter [Winogradskyella]|uniref:ion transporter n=1 Tax=Winogradskyella TaxID=286104 RepID=UPI0015CA148A|nr:MULTISPECIES: ion transporter [Winogradskyella]QXP77847.1 ion transporter [Winogradskyella sp. HaHa_3_26]
MKAYLKSLVELNGTKRSLRFAYFIQFLIILSVITFSIETLPDLKPQIHLVLKAIEAFCVIVFTFEYLARIYVAENKTKFIFSFFGIVDFLAILPFYLSFGIDLRSLRLLRMFRLFRLFKLVRYNKAMRHFANAMRLAKEQIILFMMITLMLIYFTAVGIYYFENQAQPEHFSSIFSSLWWSIVTLTTVGYGDVYPITIGGRIFTFFMLLIGLGVVAIPTGIISSSLTKAIEPNDEGE